MTSRRSRTTSTIAALFTAVALGVPAAARATAPAGSSTAATAAVPAVTPISAPAASVVLPTGDRVTVGTGVNPPLTVDRTPGASDAFATATVGGDRYVIPAEAAPYVGRGLDLSLFDVTKLAAAPDPSARIPVQLTFAAGLIPTAPAGVTFTAVSGQSATGYLTPDSGRAFAQALRDAIKADLAAGHQAGTAPASGTAQLYWNGQLVSSDTDQLGYLLKNIAAGPATVRTVFDYDRGATGITQSTKIHTDVTIPYSGRDEPGMKLPSGAATPLPADQGWAVEIALDLDMVCRRPARSATSCSSRATPPRATTWAPR
ncbi:hypothetical protein [Catenulispora pinistramenti]|uniref:hypothetical protein n=1 Tax=Catenulispora pinistramenti TaxID=2705254 RepID=UPI001E554755|nr:hypothetical protein [Catenulispora pinistramenti]